VVYLKGKIMRKTIGDDPFANGDPYADDPNMQPEKMFLDSIGHFVNAGLETDFGAMMGRRSMRDQVEHEKWQKQLEDIEREKFPGLMAELNRIIQNRMVKYRKIAEKLVQMSREYDVTFHISSERYMSDGYDEWEDYYEYLVEEGDDGEDYIAEFTSYVLRQLGVYEKELTSEYNHRLYDRLFKIVQKHKGE
jgi:hypothetical protein